MFFLYSPFERNYGPFERNFRSERTASVQRENNLTNLYFPHSVRTEHTSVRTERRVSAAVFQSIRVPFERN